MENTVYDNTCYRELPYATPGGTQPIETAFYENILYRELEMETQGHALSNTLHQGVLAALGQGCDAFLMCSYCVPNVFLMCIQGAFAALGHAGDVQTPKRAPQKNSPSIRYNGTH